MQFIKGPDFPTRGLIMGRAGIRSAYATGRGKITVRAKAEIVEKKNGRFEIQVTEIPYMVKKADLIEKIANLVKEKRIEGISDVNDYSSKKGMLISIDLKRDANPQVVLNQLYSYTQLQDTFGAILIALVDGHTHQEHVSNLGFIEYNIPGYLEKRAFAIMYIDERNSKYPTVSVKCYYPNF